MMKPLVKIFNGFVLLTVFTKGLHISYLTGFWTRQRHPAILAIISWENSLSIDLTSFDITIFITNRNTLMFHCYPLL